MTPSDTLRRVGFTVEPQRTSMRKLPSFESITRLVAHSLGMTAEQLLQAFRPADLADLPDVLRLRQQNIGAYIAWDDDSYLRWRYRFGRAACGFGDLWIVTRDAEPLGIIGTEEMVLVLADERLIGCRVMDILIDPRATDSGLGVWMNQAVFRRHTFTLDVGANEKSFGIVQRLFQRLPDPGTLRHPLNLERYLAQRFGRGTLSSAAAGIGNLIMWSWRRLAESAGPGGLVVRRVHRFDSSVDDLLHRSSRNPEEVLITRSAEYLNRRLLDSPRSPYQVWGTYRGDQWLGYIAWRIAHRGGGEFWMHVIDLQVDGTAGEGPLHALVTFSLRRAALANCSFVSITLQGNRFLRSLRRHGFFGPKSDAHQVVGIYARDPLLLRQLTSANWSLTALSADYDGY